MTEQQKSSEKEETDWLFPAYIFRSLPFPKAFFKPDLLEELFDYKPCPQDIFIVTYPKCGTTWTQFMVWEVMNKGAVPPSPNQMMFHHVPFLEVTGLKAMLNLPDPRTAKTHLPFHLQPYSPAAKYIYVARNPWDCCVSYYYHLKNDPSNPDATFNEYFEQFIKGKMYFGDYCDHVTSWFEHRNDPNVLFLTYEAMKKDAEKAILDIAKFLGNTYYQDVQEQEVLENCIKHSEFKYLKEMGLFLPKFKNKNPEEVQTAMEEMKTIDRGQINEETWLEVPFFRKGIVGDWKNHFSEDQIKRFYDYLTKKWENTELLYFWPPVELETTL